ncbi:MAG: GNAT family N-acetyltransferase [bacterium]
MEQEFFIIIMLKADEFYHILDEVIPGGNYEQIKDCPDRSLYLQRISVDGLEEMHDYSKDKRLYKYFEYEHFKSIDDTEKYLKGLIEQEGKKAFGRTAICWFVRRIEDKKLIGTIRLVNIEYRRQSVDWGYAISPKYWGQGYILEMQDVVKKYIFEKLHLNRISGITMIDNVKTQSSLLAAGAKQEGILRQYYFQKGRFKDGWIYSILAKDYFAEKGVQFNNIKTKEIDEEFIVKIIAETLDNPYVSVHDNICSVENWDSLNHIKVILEVEEKTGYKFSPEEISRATSVHEIYRIISSISNRKK